jgi:ATP-dependent Zn protease
MPLDPEQPVLAAEHDHTKAQAFAKIAVAASPSVSALIEYCKSEARGLLESNIDIVRALVAALIEKGTLVTDEIDEIISGAVVARSAEKEHKRRSEWRAREASADRFQSRQPA